MTCASSERPGEYLRGQCTLECTSRPAGGIRRNIIYFIALFVLTSPPPPPLLPLAVHAPSCPSRVATKRASTAWRVTRVSFIPLSLSLPLCLPYTLVAHIYIYAYGIWNSLLLLAYAKKRRGKKIACSISTRGARYRQLVIDRTVHAR